MGNFASSPSPTVPLNSIARDKPSEDRHEKANFVTHALSVFESIQSSKEPPTKAFTVDFASECVQALSSKIF